MKKEELINIISQRLASQGRETAVAFDVFLQKVAESLEVNESVKIPEVGIFQLKRRGGASESGAQERSSFYLLFVPLKYNRRDKNEVLAFQVNPRNVKKAGLEDDVFSLSVDQPVIPVTEQARKDFLVHSSYLMMQKNFEDKAENLLSNSVTLSDFEIEYNLSSVTPEAINPELTPEEDFKNEEGEHLPWDFGEEEEILNTEDITGENSAEEFLTEENTLSENAAAENTEDDFDAMVAKITGGFAGETPSFDAASNDMKEDFLTGDDEIPHDQDQAAPRSETEEILNEILPDDKLKVPDDLFKDLLGESEMPEDENALDLQGLRPDGELGDDWFSLDEIEDDEETVEESAQVDDQAENIDEKLELLTEMDAGLEIDPFEDFTEETETPALEETFEEEVLEEEVPEEEVSEEEILGETILEDTPAEEKPQDELELPEEGGLSGFTALEGKMPEDEEEDEAEHTSKYPAAFWAILGAVVLITLGGVYYFFFMGKSNPLLPDFAKKEFVKTEKTPAVKPQIIERDYSVPVTVYERSTEDASKAPEEQDASSKNAGENGTPAQNNPSAENNNPSVQGGNTPAQGNPPAQTNGSAQNNTKVQNNAQMQNNAPVEKNNIAVQKNNAPVQSNVTAKTTPPVQKNIPSEMKQQVNKTPDTKLQQNTPAVKNNNAVKNNTAKNNNVVKNTPAEKNAETSADLSIQPRSDTKNKLIKEYIFTDGRGRYTIQESSWQSMAEAVKRVKHFRSKGLDAYYTKYAPKGEKVWYRVRVGDYNSLEDADGALKKLK